MYDIVIIGGGPAGMSAAVAAYEKGIRNMLIVEREPQLGGILRQCIHNGFGLHKFGRELTGPEYAQLYIDMVKEREIPYITNASVLAIDRCEGGHAVTVMSSQTGMSILETKAVVMAMGCRERSRGALSIPGTRPAGIYTAGTAQKFIRFKGKMPGKNVVILGSGDIGLIMARRMTLEGANVKMVCELMPYSGGLNRNIVQCLNDFNIPLRLSHTVAEIHGGDRIEGVTIAKVDENRRPIDSTREYVECDTLLLSCALIPENRLATDAGSGDDPITGGATVNQNRETAERGIFSCGNVLHVHDLVDYVSEEAEIAGNAAAEFAMGKYDAAPERRIAVKTATGVRYTVPQAIDVYADTDNVKVYFRVSDIFKDKSIVVRSGEGEPLYTRKGRKFAPGEMEFVILKREMIDKSADTITIGLEG